MKKFFMSLLWVLLFAALGFMYYYQTTFDGRLVSMNNRAKAIEDKYQGYTDDLHDFDVRLIGQRKHINQNSQRFIDLKSELSDVKDQHSSDMFYINTRIDSLGSIVEANQVQLRNRIDDVDKKVSNLRRTVTQNNIRATQQLQDLSREIEKLQNQFTELDTTVVKKKVKR
jgi:archaellum component FlaC